MAASLHMAQLVMRNITMLQAFEAALIDFLRKYPDADLEAVKRYADAVLAKWEEDDPERHREVAALEAAVVAIFKTQRSS